MLKGHRDTVYCLAYESSGKIYPQISLTDWFSSKLTGTGVGMVGGSPNPRLSVCRLKIHTNPFKIPDLQVYRTGEIFLNSRACAFRASVKHKSRTRGSTFRTRIALAFARLKKKWEIAFLLQATINEIKITDRKCYASPKLISVSIAWRK